MRLTEAFKKLNIINEAKDFTEEINSKDNLSNCPNCGAHNSYTTQEKAGDKLYICDYCGSILYREPLKQASADKTTRQTNAASSNKWVDFLGIDNIGDSAEKSAALSKAGKTAQRERFLHDNNWCYVIKKEKRQMNNWIGTWQYWLTCLGLDTGEICELDVAEQTFNKALDNFKAIRFTIHRKIGFSEFKQANVGSGYTVLKRYDNIPGGTEGDIYLIRLYGNDSHDIVSLKCDNKAEAVKYVEGETYGAAEMQEDIQSTSEQTAYGKLNDNMLLDRLKTELPGTEIFFGNNKSGEPSVIYIKLGRKPLRLIDYEKDHGEQNLIGRARFDSCMYYSESHGPSMACDTSNPEALSRCRQAIKRLIALAADYNVEKAIRMSDAEKLRRQDRKTR